MISREQILARRQFEFDSMLTDEDIENRFELVVIDSKTVTLCHNGYEIKEYPHTITQTEIRADINKYLESHKGENVKYITEHFCSCKDIAKE